MNAMKKYGIGSRVLTVLLVLAMVVSMIPASIFAAIGDIAVGDDIGSTGLSGNVNTQNTISWPIRILDYLNDGMLFEYPNASDSGDDISDMRGGAYGGGHPAPHFTGAQDVIGTDYTVDWGYTESPYTYWLGSISQFTSSGSQIEAVNFKSPRHLRLVPYVDYTEAGNMAPWVMSDFVTDNGSGYAKDEVRYAVLVYRTSGLEDGKANVALAWSTDYNQNGSKGTQLKSYTGASVDLYYNYSKGVDLVANSDSWNYVVIDMKTGTLGDLWDSVSEVNQVLVDFAMLDKTDSVDISHVAYFDTEFEAIEFGKDAVAFDNDPGEFLDSHVEYYTNQEVAVTKPTTNSNGMDFSVSDKSSGGYAVSTYKGWTTAKTGLSYIGTINGVSVNAVNNDERSYVQVSNPSSSNRNILLWEYSSGGAFQYATIVYKTSGFTSNADVACFVRTSSGGGSNMNTSGIAGAVSASKVTLKKSEDEWTYLTYDFSKVEDGDGSYSSSNSYAQYGLYLPECMTGNSDVKLEIAFVQLTNSSSTAASYGKQAAAYMNGETEILNGSYTTTEKKWNTGNNVAFSMLYANQGGGWVSDGTSRGGTNTEPNGYYSYQIGMTYPSSADSLGQNDDRTTAKNNGYTVSDYIYLVNKGNVGSGFDTSVLDLGGYGLFNTFNSGVYTAGLLKSSLTTVTGTDGKTYRVPDYKEETVEYIAAVLRDALRIAQTDTSGNYNYNFVKGTANGEQYGYDDNGNAMDLASALRKELNVVLPATGGKAGSGYAELGDYAKLTDADKAGLIGEFAQVKENIDTFVDAAYYLLMNLYVGDSYNQEQDEYSYLVLSNGTVSTGSKNAYVFDGGFTTGDVSASANTDEYRNASQSAVVYDKNLDTISLSSAASKDQVYFEGSSATTRFPFLPVTDAEGVYAGETKSPYFLDDGRGVMGVTEEGSTFVNRNYNFAMASNGEFVFHYDEDLFFEFEGDDDVYLFINGELVLDIGGAHSITNVGLNVNDYVDWAKKVLANPSAYSEAQVARARKLNLKDGQKYTFDFYYMERHGWGSNCRIVSNIVVTDPTLSTDKQAYQGTDVNGNPIEVPFGGVVDTAERIGYSFAITNKGETKLYKLGFEDADIGLNLTWDGGLQIYGAPTVETFTTSAANTKLTVSGLNGIVNLDGETVEVTAAGTDITVAEAGSHTLTLYMYEADASNPKNPLFTDAEVTVTIGSTTKKVEVQGIYVSDKDGNYLDVSDLIITVDGYASKENYENGIAMPTFYIEGKKNEYGQIVTPLSNENLKSFLTNLLDPNGQTQDEENLTEEEAAANLYAHDGLWQNATVKISGFYYTLTESQQKENRFTNTVYTTGYKFKNGTAPMKSQDRHRVYGLGSYAYYQWANNTVHLDIKTLWDDVLGVFASPDESLYEQRDQIDILNKAITTDGVIDYTKLKVNVTDSVGDDLTASYNLYANGIWSAYNVRRIYFTNGDNWTDVYAYYWSDTNDHMVGWPGVKMTSASGKWYADIPMDAEYIIFSNGTEVEETARQQTADLLLTASANLYTGNAAGGTWSTFTTTDNPDPVENRIYFNNNETWNADWTNVYAYYWSDTNTGMTKWPGEPMKNTASNKSGTWYIDVPEGAEYIIFNNGSGGMNNQTGDLRLPETAYSAVKWNGTNHVLEVNFSDSGRQIFYVKVSSVDTSVVDYVIVPVVFYVTNVEQSNYVLDYGLSTGELSADVLKYDDLLANYGMTKAQFMGYLVNSNDPRYLGAFSAAALAAQNINRVAFDGSYLSGSYAAADGIFNITGTAAADIQYADGTYSMADGYSLSFTPNKIMDEEYSLWMAFRVYQPEVKKWDATSEVWTTSTFEPNAIGGVNGTTATYKIDIHNEVQMLKKITVLPATVVYYEDDFVDISYTKAEGTFTKVGDGSGSLMQGIAAETPYGQDAAYQGSANAELSGNSMTKIKINNTDLVASFGFKGTGFELISRTNAYDSASLVVKVYSAALDANGNIVKSGTDPIYRLPVITEYTNASGSACSHAKHGTDGLCNTCGQRVEHTYVVEKANTYWYSVSKSATKVIFSDGTSQSADIELNTSAVDVEVKTAASDGSVERTLGTYTVKQDPNNANNWRIYFTDTSGMGRMYLYAWSADGDSTVTHTDSWPGSAMEPASFCSGCGKTGMDYYLLGYLNGSDYYGKNYKFVDGQVTLELSKESFVYVQSSLGEDYKTSGYDHNATTAFLYQNATNADKLRIPGNVEARFTLTVNEDGSLTLSYAASPLDTSSGSGSTEEDTTTRLYYDNSKSKWSAVNVHYWGGKESSWPGVAMTKIEGTEIYYCDVPNDITGLLFNYNGDESKTHNITPSEEGNIYIEGSRWAVYEPNSGKITELDIPTTIYYDNSQTKWSTVKAFYWTDQYNKEEIVGWSGTEMTKIGDTEIYSVTIPEHMEFVIFNNGNGGDGNQTGNIQLSAKGNIYTTDGVWATYDVSTGQITGGVCNHAYTSEVTTAATCSKPGVRTYTCSICKESYTESIATIDHTYSNGQCTVCGAGYAIHQVPVIRVDELTYGYYYVEISGMPTYDFSNAVYNPETGEMDGAVLQDTYLYIDGVRIYQPLNTTNSHYYQNENGASFEELRDMILEGNAAVAVYEKDKQKNEGASTIYSGNKSWTENRNGWLGENKTEFIGNQVGSIDDYMLVGPNNEAYLNGNNTNQAVIFYVTENTAVSFHSLQIAARAIDAGLFLTGESTGAEATLYQGVKTDGGYAWKLIDTIQSGTEQYYTIDYSACPYTEDANGVRTYQIALYVGSGMVSFSSVKFTGVNLSSNNLGEKTKLVYTTTGFLENVAEGTSYGWNYYNISEQMKATVFVNDEDADTTPDHDGSDNSGSDNSGSDNTGSGDAEINPSTGDVELAGLIVLAMVCIAFISLASRKKLIG